jgi:hypothetical protein
LVHGSVAATRRSPRAQSLTIAKTVARQYGPYPIDPNQELAALAVCNSVVAVAKGYPVTGSFSRTAVNAASGGTTPVSSGAMRWEAEEWGGEGKGGRKYSASRCQAAVDGGRPHRIDCAIIRGERPQAVSFAPWLSLLSLSVRHTQLHVPYLNEPSPLATRSCTCHV